MPSRIDVALGDHILVPRTYHLVLATVTTVLTLLVNIPSWIFFKKAIVFEVGYLILPAFVIGGMWTQAVMRVQKRYRDRSTATTWMWIGLGSDRLIGVTALAAVILIAVQSGFSIYGLIGCATAQAQCISNLFNCSGITEQDWTVLYRTPTFATDMLYCQLCRDDYAWTIAYVTVALALLVVLFLVALMMFMSRDQTLALIRRRDQEIQQREAKQRTGERVELEMAPLWKPRLGGVVPLRLR